MHVLQSLLDFIRNTLVEDSATRHALLPVIFCEHPATSATKIPSKEADGITGNDSVLFDKESRLTAFLTHNFPSIRARSSQNISDTSSLYSTINAIVIHEKIVEALSTPAPNPPVAIQFLAVVNIVHSLALTLRKEVGRRTSVCTHESELPPRYVDTPNLKTQSDVGLLAETALFGGMVCVVFQDEEGSDQAASMYDVDRIAFVLLLGPDGTAYRLDVSDIDRWLLEKKLTPFDLESLKVFSNSPSSPELSTRARRKYGVPPGGPIYISNRAQPSELLRVYDEVAAIRQRHGNTLNFDTESAYIPGDVDPID